MGDKGDTGTTRHKTRAQEQQVVLKAERHRIRQPYQDPYTKQHSVLYTQVMDATSAHSEEEG